MWYKILIYFLWLYSNRNKFQLQSKFSDHPSNSKLLWEFDVAGHSFGISIFTGDITLFLLIHIHLAIPHDSPFLSVVTSLSIPNPARLVLPGLSLPINSPNLILKSLSSWRVLSFPPKQPPAVTVSSIALPVEVVMICINPPSVAATPFLKSANVPRITNGRARTRLGNMGSKDKKVVKMEQH